MSRYNAFEERGSEGITKKKRREDNKESVRRWGQEAKKPNRPRSNNPIGQKIRRFRRKLRSIFGGPSVSEGTGQAISSTFSSIFGYTKKRKRRR